MPFGAPDLRAFCSMGDPVVFNGQSSYADTGAAIKGIFDRPMQTKLADQGFGGTDVYLPELRLPFNAFNPMPTNRDLITVAGVDYTIADTDAEDDGAFLVYYLKAA